MSKTVSKNSNKSAQKPITPTKSKNLNKKIPQKRKKVEIVKTFCCQAQVRYHQQMINCEVKILSNGNCEVEFAQPVRAVAMGQSIVFYDGEIMLGGGIIEQKLDD